MGISCNTPEEIEVINDVMEFEYPKQITTVPQRSVTTIKEQLANHVTYDVIDDECDDDDGRTDCSDDTDILTSCDPNELVNNTIRHRSYQSRSNRM